MLGKISVGVRNIAKGPKMSNKSASTRNVYGRESAMRTIHMSILRPDILLQVQ